MKKWSIGILEKETKDQTLSMTHSAKVPGAWKSCYNLNWVFICFASSTTRLPVMDQCTYLYCTRHHWGLTSWNPSLEKNPCEADKRLSMWREALQPLAFSTIRIQRKQINKIKPRKDYKVIPATKIIHCQLEHNIHTPGCTRDPSGFCTAHHSPSSSSSQTTGRAMVWFTTGLAYLSVLVRRPPLDAMGWDPR